MYRKVLAYIAAIFGVYTVAGVLQKPVFLWLYGSLAQAKPGFGDFADVMLAGLPMDMAVAGYLTAIPALAAIACLWLGGGKALKVLAYVYYAMSALALSATAALNLGLYGYWEFPLDMTPVFYFTSSPSAAMASAGIGEAIGGIAAIAVFAALIFAALMWVTRLTRRGQAGTRGSRIKVSCAGILALGLLFLAIRGGVTVSTMNLSRAYFSEDRLLNHAAVNPVFSLLYSAAHQADFGSQYRFMPDAECEAIMDALADKGECSPADTLFSTSRPDIYLVILESFSSHLLPSLGGEAVATGLDSVAADGVLFSNMYASSFRTDRALPAILSAFPAQPGTSLLKFTSKFEKLPSLPRSLKDAGWEAEYYYGGDADFTNMRAYLKSCGFGQIVCDKDFPVAERTSKWGAHDHLVFGRALADALSISPEAAPQFKVIQTSSSHEPFEVPFTSGHSDARCNAFAYTDSCLTAFLNGLKASGRYDRSIVAIVPDHYGAYPQNLPEGPERHRIPFVLTGGALARHGLRVDSVAAQTDIVATLLAQLGIDHSGFAFSKDVLSPSAPKHAFFSTPSYYGLVTESSTAVHGTADTDSAPADSAAAYLQTIYTILDTL